MDKKNEIPNWELEPYQEFGTDIRNLYNYFNQFKNCITFNSNLPQLFDVLNEAASLIDTEVDSLDRDSAQTTADFAQIELENDFSFIHGQWSILLYTNLEALVKKLVINNIIHTDFEELDVFKKIKLGKFSDLSLPMRYDSIYRHYEFKVSSGKGYGIKRFEAILRPFGYDWESRDITCEKINELAQVRNLLLHRNGVVDSSFIEKCPWLKFSQREKINVSYEMYLSYFRAITDFAVCLRHRIRERNGENIELIKNEYEKNFI
ncbi:hypothetical protein [Aequorivita antarctica]|uniref:RiboL-PSP-HEPN domain-containing protein n=1 Tax=Aequorivita antarctica TaxID=153266 RepID=A0A5C6Z210_9FLAO|nr:hypothetical protein [Aequorivita antarctica]TXD73530.1 hypothetical protein ESU54_07140 [Aequorivita antarctica]SRX76323.1 hypothetical protein AEQU3_03323 [Aequorivita antarctica]